MTYDYDSNLELKDRVIKVASEIKKEYPLISTEDAVKAAAISSPISGRVTIDEKFERLYHILMVIGKENSEFPHVFNDIFNIYESEILNEVNTSLMGKIIEYICGNINEFPYMYEENY